MSTNNHQHVQTTSLASAAQSTLSVRPRANRLISGLSDADDTEWSSGPALVPSPGGSRSASPLPAAHPQRSNPAYASQKFNSTSWGRRAQIAAPKNGSVSSPTATTFSGVFGSSWTTLQGFASDILGNDVPSDGGAAVKDNKKLPLPKWYRQMTLAPKEGGNTTSAWASASIGTGTNADRESAVRAQKRKDMLQREHSTYADTLGKFKRRLSDDMESRSAPPGEDDERGGALVYLHHVQKDDTMAGISIKYNCSANVLRKANRLWTNDTPQARQTLVIPVGQCGVKGRPIESGSVDILGFTEAESIPRPQQGKDALPNGHTAVHTRSNSQTSSATGATDNAPPWDHDSWVQLPNFPQPTEIARLSRRTLGYFPPARRKSIDRNTPSTSLDLQRVSTSDARHDSQSPQRPRRGRRHSNVNNGYFPSYLAGPGGVGTMNKNVRCPGPAQDGLNKMFAKHLPDVAPPRNQTDLYQPEVPLYTDETPISSGVATPTGRNANMQLNLENVGGAIESWARRMVTKAMTPTEAQAKHKAARASVGNAGKGAGGIGDLIEMTDEFEIGGDDEEDEALQHEPERGRQISAVAAGSSRNPLNGGGARGDSSAAYGGGGKARKRD
ncbi:hypothetical protein BDY17DRAFT_315699 [Neohortaea acidophila]|uniref:LysM domain-containing protein n=1 Tax=Neohortaea acidophila TaxID=245834 RepID=A0A6A6PYL4_9PEZI|nr:uncharacterized protein BDY17DRAFT_315699 [Neohortaea acidophila]KAF2485220.1 hypothetical protein BDY17DRAFT_315699 [Neohortaea acidophila]